uniref:Uncharacterized protein n=1 Tax=Opuntia streptacantha TaxID=393608 RepID=A0A7C9CVY1_OPUST
MSTPTIEDQYSKCAGQYQCTTLKKTAYFKHHHKKMLDCNSNNLSDIESNRHSNPEFHDIQKGGWGEGSSIFQLHNPQSHFKHNTVDGTSPSLTIQGRTKQQQILKFHTNQVKCVQVIFNLVSDNYTC